MPQNYMQALDLWTEQEIIAPLRESPNDATTEQVKKALRAKMLESYRNGQTAKTPYSPKHKSYGKR